MYRLWSWLVLTPETDAYCKNETKTRLRYLQNGLLTGEKKLSVYKDQTGYKANIW